MPKIRKNDKHLPPRVYIKHNAYYYVNLNNKWIRLASVSDYAKAMAKWAEITSPIRKTTTMHNLFHRYMLEVAPLKSPGSYKKNVYQMKEIREVFGDMLPEDITPVDVYRYLDMRGKLAPVSANREKSLLSHVFSMAIRWGIVRDNPCRNVKRLTERPRDRYIEDWEYFEVRKVADLTYQLLMDFAYITGQRRGDIIKIKLSDISDDGIKIYQNKTKIKINIKWSIELRKCIDEIMKLPRSKIVSFTLFCNRKGKPITSAAFDSAWQKIMKAALANGKLKESFTFHDIRAKTASDAKNKIDVSALLGHTDIRMTERVYNRKYRNVSTIKR
ncbi:MAG TPA: tyrosine-type recombinase/integrase [Candidatus Babeliales bacterium]|jgi:integrase|nr:tyrosine-type recombinase/integrase [Candidatus Babeliales bacterium]